MQVCGEACMADWLPIGYEPIGEVLRCTCMSMDSMQGLGLRLGQKHHLVFIAALGDSRYVIDLSDLISGL